MMFLFSAALILTCCSLFGELVDFVDVDIVLVAGETRFRVEGHAAPGVLQYAATSALELCGVGILMFVAPLGLVSH
jgi:hypothetical protein